MVAMSACGRARGYFKECCETHLLLITISTVIIQEVISEQEEEHKLTVQTRY